MTKKEIKNLDKLEYARKIYFDAYKEIMKIDENSDSKVYRAKLAEIKSKTKLANSILKGGVRELRELKELQKANQLKEPKRTSQKTITFYTDVKVISDGEKKTIYLKD